MVLNTLGVTETMAIQFLLVAGIMDFIASFGIFLPGKIGKTAMGYIVFWGLATTLARYTSFLDMSYFMESLNEWTWQVLIRIPHFMIPLSILLFQNKRTGMKMTDQQYKQRHDKPILFTET